MMRVCRTSGLVCLCVFGMAAVVAAIPHFAVSYVLILLFLFFVHLTLAVSYDLVGGYMGYMNLGHATFFGVGAYSAAIALNRDLGLPAALVLATVLPAVVAATISFPLFRLRGAYFALATFGMVSLAEVLCNNLTELTGGSGGISTPSGNHVISAYYLSAAVGTGTVLLSYGLVRSRYGLALFGIRDDEDVAESLGVPTGLIKSSALVISSIPAGLIGGVYMWNVTYISPSAVFGLEMALSPIIMAMLGGTGTLVGPLVGAVFLTAVQEMLWTRVPYLHLTMYGAVLVLVGLFMPGGLIRTRWARYMLARFGMTGNAC